MIDIEEAKEFVTKFDPPEAEFALKLIAEIERLKEDGDNQLNEAEDSIIELRDKNEELILTIKAGGECCEMLQQRIDKLEQVLKKNNR